MVLIAGAVVAFAAVNDDGGGDDGEEETLEARGTDDLDVAVTPLEGRPSSIAAAAGRIWVTDDQRNLVVPLDPDDGTFAGDAVEISDGPVAIAAAGDEELWVAHAGGQVTRLELTDDGATADEPLQVGGTLITIAVDRDSVWVGDINGRAVRRIDRTTQEMGEPIGVFGGVVRAVPDGQGGLWVTNLESTVTRVDAESGDLDAPVRVGPGPIGAAVVGGELWVASSEDGTISRIDIESRQRVGDAIEVGKAPIALAADDEHVWVLNQDDNSLTRLTRDGARTGDDVGLGSRPRGLVLAPAGVWAAGIDPSAAVLVSPRSG